MKSVSLYSATAAPPIILQADRVRRRVAASDSVALLLSELAFGAHSRDHAETLHLATRARVASYAEVR